MFTTVRGLGLRVRTMHSKGQCLDSTLLDPKLKDMTHKEVNSCPALYGLPSGRRVSAGCTLA